ncbi:hypothetical protein EJ02DRAFT_376047 [Clathrospora elynae]|uniref:Uncharacterized protein n=1 Tax=Clathrospora elynae TaxID=706981 RepID=A0A6A5SNP2_9PLEO|nr:hypothetical protein EJ02DRAFT_376047 [Clathrospora elynae]
MSKPNGNPNGNPSGSPKDIANDSSDKKPATFYHGSVELADLGIERFDHDTAAAGDRDYALNSQQPVIIHAGRAPRGFENQVFQWSIFQHTTRDANGREELKGDLHEGTLHRQNRAADAAMNGQPMGGHGGRGGHWGIGGGGRGTRGRGSGRGGRGAGARDDGRPEPLCAGRKPERDAPPLAMGCAEEIDKNLFWNEAII